MEDREGRGGNSCLSVPILIGFAPFRLYGPLALTHRVENDCHTGYPHSLFSRLCLDMKLIRKSKRNQREELLTHSFLYYLGLGSAYVSCQSACDTNRSPDNEVEPMTSLSMHEKSRSRMLFSFWSAPRSLS